MAVCTLFSAGKIIAQNRDYPIQPVTFNRVHVHDDFWAPRIANNVDITIPYCPSSKQYRLLVVERFVV